MSGRAHRSSRDRDQDQSGGGEQQGAQDLGSNAAMQDEMLGATASDSGPIEAPVVSVLPHENGEDVIVWLARGSSAGVESGWEVQTQDSYGYIQKIMPRRAKAKVYGVENMNGEKEKPRVGRTLTIHRRRLN